MSIIDSFFIALGYKIDPESSRQVQRQVEDAKASILSLGNVIKGIATGFAVKEIAEIGSTFEQNRIQIAGFLSALGQSKDYQTGLQDAADVIQQITKDAAKLPGEAEEYIEVFKGGLPFVQGAMPGGSLKEMTDFTNQLTAIGKTFGLDAGLIAREFDHMLTPGRGTAGLRLPLFRQLMPFMRQVKGQAHLTAESFNAMTAPARLQLLQSTFSTLAPMLKESETSFDAMWGAAKSMVKTMVRLGTSGLFQGMKDGLEAVSALFVDDNGKVTALGQAFVDVGQKIGYFITRTIRMVMGFSAAFFKLAQSSLLVKAGLVALAGGLLGIKKILTGGLIGAIILIAEDLYTFYEGGESVTGLLVREFGPALELIEGLLTALGIAFVVVQAQAVGAGIKSAIAWAIASAPILLMIAALGLLAASIAMVIAKWDEMKATVKFLPRLAGAKVMDSLNGLFGGDKQMNEAAARARYGKELEDIAYKKSGMLTPGAAGPEFRADMMGPPGAPKGAPEIGTAAPPAGADFDSRWAALQAAGQVVNIERAEIKPNIVINTNDSKAAGREVEKAVIRSAQKGFKQ